MSVVGILQQLSEVGLNQERKRLNTVPRVCLRRKHGLLLFQPIYTINRALI